MKKMILGLVMVVMMLGCVGCGKEEAKNAKEIAEIVSENEGFVPEQVVEEPVITEEVAQDIEEVIDENNLEKYYDVTEFIGTPRLETVKVAAYSTEEVYTIVWTGKPISADEDIPGGKFEITNNGTLKLATHYKAILTDNNTPDDYSDDLLAYVFTTPVEE